MTDRDDLYAAVLAHPDDWTPRKIFADYLDDYGDEGDRLRAEFIRRDCRWEETKTRWKELGGCSCGHHITADFIGDGDRCEWCQLDKERADYSGWWEKHQHHLATWIDQKPWRAMLIFQQMPLMWPTTLPFLELPPGRRSSNIDDFVVGWAVFSVGHHYEVRFRGGFVEDVRTSAELWYDGADEILRHHPIRNVYLRTRPLMLEHYHTSYDAPNYGIVIYRDSIWGVKSARYGITASDISLYRDGGIREDILRTRLSREYPPEVVCEGWWRGIKFHPMWQSQDIVYLHTYAVSRFQTDEDLAVADLVVPAGNYRVRRMRSGEDPMAVVVRRVADGEVDVEFLSGRYF